MRQEHLAGEKCFVDYCGPTMPVTNRDTGEILQTQIFVGVIIRLGKRYGNDRVEAACRRAYRTNAISYSSVDSILKHRLDELPLPQDTKPSSLPLFHDNVRGPEYHH